MRKRKFGTNKRLYVVLDAPDDGIEVHVYTENQEVRRIIENNRPDPDFFLRTQMEYAASSIAAKKWLANVISEYHEYFVSGKVTFIMRSFYGENIHNGNVDRFLPANNLSLPNNIDDEQVSVSKYGFQPVGIWTLNELRDALSFTLSAMENERVLYAFIIDDKCKYVGVCDNTNTTLKGRMKRYQRMVGGGTNERVNLEIKKSLLEGHSATIWALKPEEEYVFKSLQVDLVKGLENPLIQKLHPEWNIKG